MNVQWSAASDRDLIQIWRYLAHESSPAIADRQLRSIEFAALRLASYPFSGRARPELSADLRSLSVGSYLLLYKVEPPTVQVLRVVHGRRDLEGMDVSDSEPR